MSEIRKKKITWLHKIYICSKAAKQIHDTFFQKKQVTKYKISKYKCLVRSVRSNNILMQFVI